MYPAIQLGNWSCIILSMAGSRPEGGCTVTLQDVVDEHFFNSDLVVQLDSASEEFDNVVEVLKKMKKRIPKKRILTIYQGTCPFSS